MPKRIICYLTVEYVPLPPERIFAWREALRMLALACKPSSSPAQAGSPVGMSPPSQLEALPGAGMTSPLTGDPYRPPSPLQSQPDPLRLAQNTAGNSSTDHGSTDHCDAG
jgi:hypothetical protein